MASSRDFIFEQKQPVLTLDVGEWDSFGYLPHIPNEFNGILRMHRGFESITANITLEELKLLAENFQRIYDEKVAADKAFMDLPFEERERIADEKNREMFGELWDKPENPDESTAGK